MEKGVRKQSTLPSSRTCMCSLASCSRPAVKTEQLRNGRHALRDSLALTLAARRRCQHQGFQMAPHVDKLSSFPVVPFGFRSGGGGAEVGVHEKQIELAEAASAVAFKDRLHVSQVRWNQPTSVFSVSSLWTTVFCDYYYGETTGEDKDLGRRLSEFIYFFTMCYSCISTVLGRNSFCLVARDDASHENERSKEAQAPVGAIAARLITDKNFDSVFLQEDWNRIRVEEFRSGAGDDLCLLYLWNFGIDSKHRKKGAATRMMDWLEEETGTTTKNENGYTAEADAKAQETQQGEDPSFLESACGKGEAGTSRPRGVCLFVYRTNRPAIKLYEKLGYKVVDSWKDPRWLAQAEKHSSITVQRKLLMIKHI